MLASLGIGEALVTGLNEKGIPTPLAATHLRTPASRIGVLTPDEISQNVSASSIAAKYNEVIDRESAFEILKAKLNNAAMLEQEASKDDKKKKTKEEKSTIEGLSENTMVRQVGKAVVKEVARGLLGVLGLGGGSNRKKKNSSWF